MNKTFITALALIGACAATTQAADQKGSKPEAGRSYCLYNVGAKQFLGTDNGQLVLGGEKVEVTLQSVDGTRTPGFFRIVQTEQPWTASLFGAPLTNGGGKYDEWRIEPVKGGGANTYAIASRNSEASASFYIYQNSIYNSLAVMPQQPAGEFEAAQWLLVDNNPVIDVPEYEYTEGDTHYESHNSDLESIVHIYRNFALNSWNTFCSPVDLSEAQLKEQMGDDVKVAELTAFAGSELKFTTTHTIKAGKPYIINPTMAPGANGYQFSGYMTFATEAGSTDMGGVVFYGTLSVSAPAKNSVYGFDEASAIVPLSPASYAGGIAALGGYFVTKYATAEITSWSLDGTTGIGAINTDGSGTGSIYSIGGQKVGKGGTKNLERGIYIVGGKKEARK